MTLLESFIALDTLNLLALLGVVFIGLPHGAMDGAVAVHFGWMGRPAKVAAFLLAYVGLAALVVAAWVVAPALSFIVFLAISTYHFGRGDATSSIVGRGAVESIARGGLVIGGISQFHRAEANDVFLTIVGADTTGVWLFLDGLLVLTAACIIETLLFKPSEERTTFAFELSILLLLFATVPPLVGFAVYFCFVHSFRTSRPCVPCFNPRSRVSASRKPRWCFPCSLGRSVWWCWLNNPPASVSSLPC